MAHYLCFDDEDSFDITGMGQVINRVGDYEDLIKKPKINGVELIGNKTFEQLGEETLTNSELKDIIDSQFATIFGGS